MEQSIAVLWERWSSVTGQMDRWPDKKAGGLLLFAAGAADSLDYLIDLDDRAFGPDHYLLGNHEDVVDLAHMRWACGTAFTAIDLGAGALGRVFLGARPTGEYDLRELSGDTLKRLRQINAWSAQWVGDVGGDHRFSELGAARDALVHRSLNRTVGLGIRASLHLRNREIDARELIITSRDFASEHLTRLFEAIESGAI